MNILKKIYCRAFQSVFKLAIPVLPYTNPIILDSVLKIPYALIEENKKSVLIVTDNVLHSMGALEPLKTALTDKEISFSVYDKTVPNPTVNNVEEARKIYLENNCNALIGFGGGSAIDCAKAVGARIVRPKTPVSKMEGILRIRKKIPLMIAVPTTAGTGSEVTVTTVITDGVTGHKFPASDFVLIPDVAVHDPEITKSLPKTLTATTGMDALTHAIEAYIGRSTVKSTRKDALKAVRLIAENLKNAYDDGNNIFARANMLTASFLAGRAFSKSYVGYCHAVAHSLGGKYNIPHGLANAVLLPYTLKAYGSSVYKKCKDIAVAMKLTDSSVSEEKATEILIEAIEKMNREMGIPGKLLGIKKEDISDLARYADKEANPLYPVPVLMDKKALEQFYFDVMEG